MVSFQFFIKTDRIDEFQFEVYSYPIQNRYVCIYIPGINIRVPLRNRSASVHRGIKYSQFMAAARIPQYMDIINVR